MKVKTEDGKVREVKPRSIVGTQLLHREIGTIVTIDGQKYQLVEK